MCTDGQISPCKHHVTVQSRYTRPLYITDFFKTPMNRVIVPHGLPQCKFCAGLTPRVTCYTPDHTSVQANRGDRRTISEIKPHLVMVPGNIKPPFRQWLNKYNVTSRFNTVLGRQYSGLENLDWYSRYALSTRFSNLGSHISNFAGCTCRRVGVAGLDRNNLLWEID